MPLDLNCPQCQHVFPVTEARHPIGVECPRCENELTAEFRKRTTTEAGQHPYELLVSPGRSAGSQLEGASVGKKLRIDNDEETARGGGSMAIVFVAGIGALLVALGGLAATGYALFTHLDTSDSSIAQIGNTNNNTKGGVQPKGMTPGISPTFPNIGNKGGFGNSGGTGPKGIFKGGTTEPPPFEPPVQKDKMFELRPVSGEKQTITEPAINLSPPVTRKLPGRAEAVTVGGNGRYLIFSIPATQQLTVFDVNKGDFIATERIPDGGEVLLAGGQNRVVTCSKSSRVLRSFSLPDLRKQFDFSYPLSHTPSAIAMGSSTNSPLLISDPFADIALVNLTNNEAKVVEGSQTWVRNHLPPDFPGNHMHHVLAAPNGKTFFFSQSPEQNQKTGVLTEQGGKWKPTIVDVSAPSISADGRYILGFNRIADLNGRTVANPEGTSGAVWYVAGVSGRGFLRLEEKKEMGKQFVSITCHTIPQLVEKDRKPMTIGVLPETEGLIDWFFGKPLPLYQHLFLIPEAKLLVVVPATKDKLVLRRVDVR